MEESGRCKFFPEISVLAGMVSTAFIPRRILTSFNAL
jgi:hypothetical protein